MTDSQKLRVWRFLKQTGEIVDAPVLKDGRMPIVYRPKNIISPIELAQIVLDKCGAEINPLPAKKPGHMVII